MSVMQTIFGSNGTNKNSPFSAFPVFLQIDYLVDSARGLQARHYAFDDKSS